MSDQYEIYKLLLKRYAIGGLFIFTGTTIVTMSPYKGTGVVLILIGLFISCIRKYLQYRNSHPSFRQNTIELHELLEENENFRQTCGPNSSSGNMMPLKTKSELTLWDAAKKEIIAPNNQKILALIEKIECHFDTEDKCIIEKMKTHIFAFQSHCKDATVDYSNHQFPIEFPNLIAQTLSGLQNPLELTDEYRDWLLRYAAKVGNVIIEMYIFGSSLYLMKAKDVDVLIYYKETPQEFVSKVNSIKKDFKEHFGVPIHLTAFSLSEKSEYDRFTERCGEKIQVK